MGRLALQMVRPKLSTDKDKVLFLYFVVFPALLFFDLAALCMVLLLRFSVGFSRSRNVNDRLSRRPNFEELR